FFFQAEDGIRDATVTGVQTCALPICRTVRAVDRRDEHGPTFVLLACKASVLEVREPVRSRQRRVADPDVTPLDDGMDALARDGRSEERRVGKEWRSRRQQAHVRK